MHDDTLHSPATDWVSLQNRLDDPDASLLHSRRQARIWGLVLEARDVPCHILRSEGGWQVLVPAVALERALRELRQYEAENRGWPPPPPPPSALIDNRFTTLCILALFGAFHDLTLHHINLFDNAPVDWTTLGNAHARKILAGEWWRALTALSLHADGLHLMGNLMIGGVFIMRLCRMLGSGLGWSLILACGFGGNLVNAWLQSPDHRAVGLSTAVFGAVGLLGAINTVRYRHNLRPGRRWPIPVAASLALLAMLGVGGENTDLGAHLWGFTFGLLLGTGTELLIERYGRPVRLFSLFLALMACGSLVGAWLTVLLRTS